MPTRKDVLSQAADECLKELYQYVIPKVSWEDFIAENKIYSSSYKEWDAYRRAYHDREKYPEKWETKKNKYAVLGWDENKSITECIGLRPYEFYYLPQDILKDIVDSYIYAYRIDAQQELLNTIEILKQYCKEPIVEKYIEEHTDEYGNHHPGYRGYDHPDNLEKELQKIFDDKILPDICKQYNKQYNLQTTGIESSVSTAYSKIFQDKFFEFLDMAGDFYKWNGELNSFNTTVYLGPSPNSSKEKVIENWKLYRGKDIEINEQQIKIDYYGEEELELD